MMQAGSVNGLQQLHHGTLDMESMAMYHNMQMISPVRAAVTPMCKLKIVSCSSSTPGERLSRQVPLDCSTDHSLLQQSQVWWHGQLGGLLQSGSWHCGRQKTLVSNMHARHSHDFQHWMGTCMAVVRARWLGPMAD